MPIALAAPAAVAAAIMALVLLFAILLLAEALKRAIDASPIPGFIGSALKWVVDRLQGAVNAMTDFLSWVARGGLSIFTAPAMAFLTMVESIALGFGRIAGWVRWVIYNQLPALWNYITSAVDNAVNYVIRYATGLFSQAIAYINAVRNTILTFTVAAIAGVQQLAYGLYRAALTALSQAIASVTSLAYQLFQNAIATLNRFAINVTNWVLGIRAQLIAYAEALAHWAVSAATTIAIDWAKRYADQLVSLYNQALTAATALALAPAWPKVIDAIDAISLALPESIAAVLARIGAIPRAIPRDVAASIGAVAAVGAIAVDWVAECGVPLCRNLGGFGREIAALEDAALMVLVVGMIMDAVEDPNGSANHVHDTIVPDMRGMVDNAFSLLTTAI